MYGLFWDIGARDVRYVWAVRKDGLFWSYHWASLSRYGEHMAVHRGYMYEVTQSELANLQQLPVALPVIGRGPLSLTVRAVLEGIAEIPDPTYARVALHLARQGPVTSGRLVRTWWRVLVGELYQRGWLSASWAGQVADLGMHATCVGYDGWDTLSDTHSDADSKED